jgi:hypothetical protein
MLAPAALGVLYEDPDAGAKQNEASSEQLVAETFRKAPQPGAAQVSPEGLNQTYIGMPDAVRWEEV